MNFIVMQAISSFQYSQLMGPGLAQGLSTSRAISSLLMCMHEVHGDCIYACICGTACMTTCGGYNVLARIQGNFWTTQKIKQ